MNAVVTQPQEGKQTTIGQLKPATAPEAQMPNVIVGFTSLQGFELTQRVSRMFAASTIVPDTFQGNLANCCIALEMASRLGASPLMVMQNLDVIYGRPAWRAKFLIASFNQCGRFEEIQYEFGGKEGTDSWSCVAFSTSKRTGKEIRGPKISIALAKEEGWYERKGSKWKTIPQLMLMYRAGAWLVNTYAPEISMGLSTDDELRDAGAIEARRDANSTFAADLESLRQTGSEFDLTPKATPTPTETPPAGASTPTPTPTEEPPPEGKAITVYATSEEAVSYIKASISPDDLVKAIGSVAAYYESIDSELPPEVDEAIKETRAALNKAKGKSKL
jgi:hypothetical protein